MSNYEKIGFGTLFPETEKKNAKGPDFNGPITVTINGNEVAARIAAWKKDGNLSFQITQKNDEVAAAPIPAEDNSLDDNIPF